jgi:predicted dehydrogenase
MIRHNAKPKSLPNPMPAPVKISGLRAGVIGTGFIGPVHIEALRRIGVRVTAICDTTERARLAADRFAIPEAYGDGDYRRLVRSPEVDVVHITAPNRFHCEMSLAALRAGKHVICEKPLAMNLGEADRIVEAARGSRRVFAVNYNVRFYPAVLELRHLIARGGLGRIIHVNGSYFQDWLFKETDYNWRLLPKEGGRLRAVADIGTHWMDTVSFILGSRIASVFADLATFHPQRKRPLGEVQTFSQSAKAIRYARYRVQTEDFANILLRFQNGARGNLGVSQVAAGRKNSIRFEIYGSKKSAWWDSEHPEQLQFGNRDEPNECAVRNTPAFGSGASRYLDYPAGHVEGFPDTFKMLFRSIYGVIARGGSGERLFAGAADGQHEVAVCEAILRSHRARRWMDV